MEDLVNEEVLEAGLEEREDDVAQSPADCKVF